MTLHFSEDRWYALHHVADQLVMHHDSCEVTTPGFSWAQTSMSDDMIAAMGELLHAGLVSVGRHQPWGAQVFLTLAGSERLSKWNLQHARGVA